MDPVSIGFGIYDRSQERKTQRGLNEILSDYANVTGPEDVQFIRRTLPTYDIRNPATALEAYNVGGKMLDKYQEDTDKGGLPAVFQELQGIRAQNPDLPTGAAVARMSPNNLAKFATMFKGGFDDVVKGLDQGVKDFQTEKLRQEKERNIAGFQEAIGGLPGPSQSPNDLRRFAGRGGYAPFPDVESDIRQAAAAYNVGDSDEVNKARTGALDLYKNTLLPPETVKVGRTTATGQKNLLGDFKKDVQSVAPVTNNKITINQANRDRTAEFTLRKEFLGLPEVKDFPTIETNARRAVAALKEQGKGSNVAVDQTIITVLNKMLDPSSVVRESEYARTPQDLALLSRIKGKFDKLASGGAGLTPDERQALNRMINNFATIASRQYNDRSEEYRNLAKEYGFNPARVVVRGNSVDEDRKAASAGGLNLDMSAIDAEIAKRQKRK